MFARRDDDELFGVILAQVFSDAPLKGDFGGGLEGFELFRTDD
jgi:hypothetical protein